MSHFKVTTNRNGRRSFGEHDDRWVDNDRDGSGGGGGRGSSGGRKSYGRGRGGKRGFGGYNNRGSNNYTYNRGSRGRGDRSRNFDGGPGPRSRLDTDGDVDMGGGSGGPSTSRYTPYGRGRGDRRRGNYGRDRDRGNRNSPSSERFQTFNLPNRDPDNQWYKVIIPFGKKFGRDALMKKLNENIDGPFIPVSFHFEQEKAVFNVQDRKMSESLRRLSNRLTMPNGFKMVVIVKPSGPPAIFSLDDEGIEKLKVCMSNRYDPATKALNLSDLYNDTDLNQENIKLALSKHTVMSYVTDIIGENIPELEILDLSNNKLVVLDNLRELVKKSPNITRLNLGKNMIRSVDDLDRIKPWNLTELILDGNDLCDRFREQTAYISAIRKRFPKIIKLDGHDLPPPITFDLDSSTSLLPVKGSFFLSPELQELIVKFLKEYFTIYDSGDRQPLLPAYSDEALFSMSTAFNPGIEYSQPKLTDYMSDSRNLTRISREPGNMRRQKTIKKGKLSIVSQLCELPKTTHDYNSFMVDVDHASAALLRFTVLGVFKEDSRSDKPPIRSFSRHFTTVPSGPGMVIVNDMLTVTNASYEQIQKAFKSQAPTPSSSPVPDEGPSVPFPPGGAQFTPEQQQKIQSFCHDSRMNPEWSAKCLIQNNWDYEKSGQVFLELQKQNKIPPEAFLT